MTIELLIGLLVVGVGIRLGWLVIRMFRRPVEEEPRYNFTVEELQDLRQQGLLSDEEFQRAAAAVRLRDGQPTDPLPPIPPTAPPAMPPQKKD